LIKVTEYIGLQADDFHETGFVLRRKRYTMSGLPNVNEKNRLENHAPSNSSNTAFKANKMVTLFLKIFKKF